MIRKQTEAHLRLPGLPREKVLALIVQLLEKSLIRVGNEEYARENKSYGLTTMLDKHVTFERGVVHFHFVGKSGLDQDILLRDARLAKLINRQDLPQQRPAPCWIVAPPDLGRLNYGGSAAVRNWTHCSLRGYPLPGGSTARSQGLKFAPYQCHEFRPFLEGLAFASSHLFKFLAQSLYILRKAVIDFLLLLAEGRSWRGRSLRQRLLGSEKANATWTSSGASLRQSRCST